MIFCPHTEASAPHTGLMQTMALKLSINLFSHLIAGWLMCSRSTQQTSKLFTQQSTRHNVDISQQYAMVISWVKSKLRPKRHLLRTWCPVGRDLPNGLKKSNRRHCTRLRLYMEKTQKARLTGTPPGWKWGFWRAAGLWFPPAICSSSLARPHHRQSQPATTNRTEILLRN